MKLAAFKDLCDREWAKDQHGDVQALHLTNSSLMELTCDVLLAGSSDPFLFPLEPLIGSDDIKGKPVGAVCRDILNPITRTVIHISGDSDRDFAEVYSMPGGLAQVTIPPDPAAKLARLDSLAATQRKTADDLRDAITAARDAGLPWRAIAEALGTTHECAYRQFKYGSPIVVVKPWQNPPHP